VAPNLPLAHQSMSAKRPIRLLFLNDDQQTVFPGGRRGPNVRVSRARTRRGRGSTQPAPGVRTPLGPRPRSKIRGRPHRRAGLLRFHRRAACASGTNGKSKSALRDGSKIPIATRGPTRGTDFGGFEKRHLGSGSEGQRHRNCFYKTRNDFLQHPGVQDAYPGGGWPSIGRRHDRIWANVGTQPLYPLLGPNRNPSGAAPSFDASAVEFQYAH